MGTACSRPVADNGNSMKVAASEFADSRQTVCGMQLYENVRVTLNEYLRVGEHYLS
jgi:hypothetical protein